MDRIDPLTGAPIPFHRNEKEKRRVEKKQPVGRDFGSVVKETELKGVQPVSGDVDTEDLEALLDEIHQAGERLVDDPGMSKVLEYKQVVRSFMQYVVKQSRRIDHQDGARLSMFKSPKRYTLISVIDGKLEQLAAGILQNQRQKLEILKKVEEIQGLLVDLIS